MVTRGQRRLGRTIRNLENSVELSAKESIAKEAEKKDKEKIEQSFEDSPVQDLRQLANKRKSYTNNE
jgi:type IV secretory pathway VirB4 component